MRSQVLVVTLATVLPVIVASTALTIHLSSRALEEDIRTSGVALARQLAGTLLTMRGTTGEEVLQREVASLLGKGGLVSDASVYAVSDRGLVVSARAGPAREPGREEETAARENREVMSVARHGERRVCRVVVPVEASGKAVAVVSLGLPLDRADALARQEERQAVLLGAVSLLLIVTSLSLLLNRALTRPVRGLAAVMERAEAGDLSARMPEERGDEVGQLARGLNRMLKRLGSFQAELEHKVADATAQLRRVNQRLFAAQHRVAKAERLAAAGELAAAMAHDVGSPLTAVSGHLQLLAEQVAEPALRARLLAVQGQVDRAVTAARRFLDAARPASLHGPVDVNALLADLLVLIQPEAERREVVIRQLFGEIPTIQGDADQLRQLFLNLLTNALESMGQGGSLTLGTEGPAEADDGARIRVVVSDTGSGMSPDVMARAFQPFFTTRGASGGTGLGLAICRRIAEGHGGTIRLESEAGRGTRAIVELPAAGQ